MAQQDFRINAVVHNILHQRRVNIGQLDFGTTNGVVYVRGSLLADAFSTLDDPTGPGLLREIERDIRTVPGVRDVVLGVKGWQKAGSTWVRTASTS